MHATLSAKILNVPPLETKNGSVKGTLQITADGRMEELIVVVRWTMECISPINTERIKVGEMELRFLELDPGSPSLLAFEVLGKNQPASLKGQKIEIRHSLEINLPRVFMDEPILKQIFLYHPAQVLSMPTPLLLQALNKKSNGEQIGLWSIWLLGAAVVAFFMPFFGVPLFVFFCVLFLKQRKAVRNFGGISLAAGESFLMSRRPFPVYVRLDPAVPWENDTLCLELKRTEYYRFNSSRSNTAKTVDDILATETMPLPKLEAGISTRVKMNITIQDDLVPSFAVGAVRRVYTFGQATDEGRIGMRYSIRAYILRSPENDQSIQVQVFGE